ncbi:YdcF family protein [Candidatus Saccharibacteria bacterium]|nr:YdcF family protein [Candidatus Saccharibacteria bacterium]
MHKRDADSPKRHRHLVWWLLLLVFVLAALLLEPTVYVNMNTRGERYELSRTDISQVPKRDVAIVLGAGLRDKGKNPSPYLQWRIETAVKLYKAGRVEKLLMSGDGSYADHDEPVVMQRVAEELGVPSSAIMLDKFGFDTYDSCSRARAWRHITSATVVTQGYHLPRAVFTCKAVGIDAIGVNAQARYGRNASIFDIAREWLSTDKLFVQIGWHDVRPVVQKDTES